MKLPIPQLFGKKEKSQYFLTLLLRDEKVSASIFEELSSKVKVIGEHEEAFKTSLDTAPEDELLDVLDKAISSAESPLPSSVETQKTIFGVKKDWVLENKIKKQYLVILKKVSDALGLIPIGFLVISEALVHLLEKEEGAPVSAILVEVGEKNSTVSLIRAGKIIETKEALIENSVAATTDKILHYFTKAEVLPSRIILFDGENSEALAQELISHSWSPALPFLHVPQITTLPEGFAEKAVLIGAASQMGFEILENDQNIPSLEDVPNEMHKPLRNVQEKIEEKIIQENIPLVHQKDSTIDTTISVEDFGFQENIDVSKQDLKETETIENIQNPEPIVPSPQENDLPKNDISSSASLPPAFFANKGKYIAETIKKIVTQLRLLKIKKVIPQLKLPGGKKIVLIPPLIIAFIVAILLFYIFALKATITVFVTPRIIEKDKQVTFSTTAPTDASKGIIEAEFVSSSQDGSVTTQATGKKEIGDKAKGTITIYNSSLSEGKTFSKGTVISTSNGIQFLLDNSASVASASGDPSSPVPSTTTVSTTAKDIGKESNLPSGTKFSIAGFESTIIAKNNNAFSGGSKKEVTVVSSDDVSKLLDDLPTNIQDAAKSSVKKQIGNDKELLPEFISTTISKKDFDKTIGQETISVTLKGTVLYQGLSYKKKDIQELSKTTIQNTDTSSIVSLEKTSYSVTKINNKNETEVTVTIHVKASLLPKIDNSQMGNELAGKSFSQAETTLKKLPSISDITIDLFPPIPLLPHMLPRIGNHITFLLKEK